MAPLEQRRIAAAAALREDLRLSHSSAGKIYGLVLTQWTRWFLPQDGSLKKRYPSADLNLVWYILAFVCDVPGIAAQLDFLRLGIWHEIVGWEWNVLRKTS